MAAVRAWWSRAAPGVYRWGGVAMLALLPLFLITLNVRVLFNAPWVYSTGFQRNEIPQRTGVTLAELNRIGQEIRDYFNGGDEYLLVELNGQPVFDAQEVVHMHDVRGLLGLVYGVTYATGTALAAYAAWGARREGWRFLRRLQTAGVASAAGVVASGAVLGLGFPLFFTLFHQISFRNDYWILDPSRHFLVVMFPQRFWLESTLLLAAVTLAQLLALYAVSRWLLRRRAPATPANADA